MAFYKQNSHKHFQSYEILMSVMLKETKFIFTIISSCSLILYCVSQKYFVCIIMYLSTVLQSCWDRAINPWVLISIVSYCAKLKDNPSIRRVSFELHIAYAKTKAQISCAVTAQLISAFVFATQVVQSSFYLNPKSQASSQFL